jgi:hypothetical protein
MSCGTLLHAANAHWRLNHSDAMRVGWHFGTERFAPAADFFGQTNHRRCCLSASLAAQIEIRRKRQRHVFDRPLCFAPVQILISFKGYVRTLPSNNSGRRARALYHIPIPKQTDLPISYNIAPSQKVLTIRFNPETQQRSLDALQWGLIPHWTKDSKIAYRTINARAETVDKAPSFRHAFAKRRCLIPADGFYEWRKTAKPKLPFALRHERRTALHLCWPLEKTGKIPDLGSGCALARLSQAS